MGAKWKGTFWTITGAFISLASLGGIVSACDGDGQDSAPAPPPPSKVQEFEAPVDPFTTNERGYEEIKIGQEVTYFAGAEVGDKTTFTINSVQVDPPCASEYMTGTPAPNGKHTLLLDVTAKTGSDENMNQELGYTLTYDTWNQLVNGVTRGTDAPTCVYAEDDLFGSVPFGLNQTYRGTVEMIVEEPSGTLILENTSGYPAGWELDY